jgi:hypothetical protein
VVVIVVVLLAVMWVSWLVVCAMMYRAHTRRAQSRSFDSVVVRQTLIETQHCKSNVHTRSSCERIRAQSPT